MKIWENLLQLLYPQKCHFCGTVNRTEMCVECKKQVEYVLEPRCKRCGKPIRYEEKEHCHDCQEHTFHYEEGRSLWLHKGKVKDSVYRFKYGNCKIYGKFYAKELHRLYGEQLKQWEIDVIIPVPLHRKRKRKRGYNQAEVLGRYLSDETGIPMGHNWVKRRKNTKPQKELQQKERNQNLQGAFEVTKHWEKGKKVLVVDDIYTTGSTIDSLARELVKKGADKVWFFTISIGQGF